MAIPLSLRCLPVALVCLTPAGEELRFGPEEGAEVVKTVVDTSSFDLDDLTITINGQDLTAMIGDLEFSMNIDQTVQVTDTYDSVEDGRVLQVTRSFDELTSNTSVTATADGQGQDQDMEGESDLEGLSVVFTWDPEAEEYDVEFDGDGGDDELLEDLDADMDLWRFLPQEEVSEGDSWEVDLDYLGPLQSPGGNLKIIPDDAVEEAQAFQDALGEGLMEEFADAFEGTCICTFVGTSEGEEGRLAEIMIEVEASATYDLSEAMISVFDAVSEQTGEEMPDISIDAADMSMDIVASGTILWDLDAGRLRSFEALGDLEIALDVSVFIEVPGQEVSMEGAAELTGSFAKSFETEE